LSRNTQVLNSKNLLLCEAQIHLLLLILLGKTICLIQQMKDHPLLIWEELKSQFLKKIKLMLKHRKES
jgi:hypothetical protein